MAQNDILKRYLDAGLAFTQLTRERAEAIVQDLVKAGDVRRKEAEQQIEQLMDRSRKNTEDLLGIIRKEVAEQLRAMGLDELAKRTAEAAEGEAVKADETAVTGSDDPAATQTSAPKADPSTTTSPIDTAPPAASPAEAAPTKGAPTAATPTKKAPAKATKAAKSTEGSPIKSVGSAKKAAAKKSAPPA